MDDDSFRRVARGGDDSLGSEPLPLTVKVILLTVAAVAITLLILFLAFAGEFS